MTTYNDLIFAIDTLLNLTGTSKILQLNSNTTERAYEAYVLSLCVEAVKRANGQATLTGIQSGANPKVVVFRGGPGSMYSVDQDFCFVRCTLAGKQFEIHVDVEYEGQTGATHEIDVSLCDGQHCNSVRLAKRAPKTNKLIMLFECKFYTSKPGVALARAFVGLTNDCTRYKLSGFVSNITTQGLRDYLSKDNFPDPYTPTPLEPATEELFIRNVEQRLRRWARV